MNLRQPLLSIRAKLSAVLLVVAVGIAILLGTLNHLYSRVSANVERLAAHNTQHDNLVGLRTLVERSRTDLDALLHGHGEMDAGALLARNEDISARMSQFKTGAETLDFSEDAAFALEQEPLVLALRDDFFQSVSLYREGRVTAAVSYFDNRIRPRVDVLSNVIGHAEELRRLALPITLN